MLASRCRDSCQFFGLFTKYFCFFSGQYCKKGESEPSDCPVGTLNGGRGRENCTACPPGRTCPFVGMNDSLPCPAGKIISS